MVVSAAGRSRARDPWIAGWLVLCSLGALGWSCATSPAPLPESTSSPPSAPCSTATKADVWACIHDSFRRAEARACYDEARRSEPEIAGHLIVAWTIDDHGAVRTVHFDEVDSQITSASVRKCVAAIFYRTRWNPGSPGHVRSAVYDFQLRP